MNYTLLVIFVACLIGCGAQIYTDVDLNAYCKDCMKEGSTSSVQPHPYRCDRYITCAIVSLDVFKAHEMPCPAGLFFDSTIKTCTWTPDCVRSCRTNDKFENSWDCNTYYECENGILSTGTPLKSCGKQKMFNETLQYCTPDNTCGKDAKSDNCTKTQKDCQVGYEFRKEECQCVKRTSYRLYLLIHYNRVKETNNSDTEFCGEWVLFGIEVDDAGVCTDQYNVMSPNSEVYLQLMNGKWIESKCIPGYSFNLTTCTCSDKIPIIYKCPESYKVHTDQGKYYILENSVYVERTCPSEHKFNLTDCRCHLQSIGNCLKINISMANDTNDIHGAYVFNKNVIVSNGYGLFNGSAYFVIPMTANNEFPNEFQIRIKFFLLQNQTGNKVAIVGNGRCDTQPTFSVSVEGALQNLPKVVIQIKTNDTSSVQISQSVSFSKWISLVIVKTESDIRVKLDKNPEVIHPAGKVERHDCAFGVGNMTNMTNLVGYVKDFYFAKCLDN